ncbi:MAG TPA: EAL domain-containing protein [Gammaproteobacteria bacterium]|nr:EAL domain-containing protein [Gammaproteobacteria bacterium]
MNGEHATGLRTKLVLLLALAIVPGMVALVTMTVSEYHARRDEMLQGAVHMAGAVASAEGGALSRAGHTVRLLAHGVRVGPAGHVDCSPFRHFLERNAHYLNAGYIRRDGTLACSSVPPPMGITELGDRRYFRGALDHDGLAIGTYQVGRVTDAPSLNMGYPVHAASGKILGVAYIAIGLHQLSLLTRDPGLHGDAFVALVGPHGHLLARYPDPRAYVGGRVPLKAILSAGRVSGYRGLVRRTDPHGLAWLYAHAPVHVAGLHDALTALVGLPSRQVYAPIEHRLTESSAGGAAVALLVFGLVWLGGERSLLRPIRELSRAAARLGTGDLAQRVGWRRRDEIGSLGAAFDRMAESLETRQRQVERTNRALRALSASNRALVRAAREGSFLRAMCEIPVRDGGYLAAWIGLAQRDGSIRVLAHHSADGRFDREMREPALRWDESPEGGGSAGAAIRTGRPVVLRELGSNPDLEPWRETLARAGVQAIVSLPLRIQDRVGGVLLIHTRQADAFDQDEMAVLEEMATDIGYGLTQMRLRRRHLEVRRELRRLSATDPVTGLASRPRFLRRFGQWERRHGPAGGRLAVAILRLHRFDSVNLAFGPATGDRVLRELGERLWRMQPTPVLVGRWGGAEVALMRELDAAWGPGELAAAVHELADRPLRTGEIDVQLGSSIGLAVYPDHGTDIETLLVRARAAADQAAAGVARYQVHRGEPEHEASRRLEVLAALMSAIDERQLQLHYQPKVDLATGRICGAEALLRWHHPQWGNVPPDRFIPLTEQTRLIQPVTSFGLHQARRDHIRLAARGFTVPMAVNLSARVLHQEGLLGEVAGLLAGSGQGRPWLELELTETAVMQDRLRNLRMLEELTELGVSLHLDDFGTGYSSMAYLQQLPVSTIKVDKSFVGDIDSNDRNAALVRATIEVAHTLGLRVVAEGVESERALGILRELGCDMAQGYFIARPMPLADLAEWMEQRDGRLASLA